MDTIARLIDLCDERNLTLYEVAQMSGLNYSTLKNNVTRNGQLKVDTIERLCGGLNIPLFEFFNIPENREIPSPDETAS